MIGDIVFVIMVGRHAGSIIYTGIIKMGKNRYLNLILIALALTFSMTACNGGNRKNLKRIKYNKEWEMRQNWNDYIVFSRNRPDSFQRGAAAFLYKLKDDKKILLDRRWVAVRTQEEKEKIKIWEAVLSAEVRGYNEELYGYLIYRSGDRPNVKIIDEQTVQLFYHYNRNYSQ